MKAVLEIELIGENIIKEMKGWSNFCDNINSGLGKKLIGETPSSGWVSEITGFGTKYKYERQFLKPKKDYSRANSAGSRGVYAEYILDEGKIYDVLAPINWKHKERYFCKVEDWKIVRIDEEEVIRCLNERWESTYSKRRSNE